MRKILNIYKRVRVIFMANPMGWFCAKDGVELVAMLFSMYSKFFDVIQQQFYSNMLTSSLHGKYNNVRWLEIYHTQHYTHDLRNLTHC